MEHDTSLVFRLGDSLDSALADRTAAWEQRDGTNRLLQKDASLFSGADEARWMGWLEPQAEVPGLDAFAESLDGGSLAEVETVFLLGMGGSSLGSEVVYRTLSRDATRRLVVLDTTNPEAVGSTLDTAEPAKSIVIAASKSGSTLETAALLELFLERFRKSLGADAAGRFVAITDPGSAFEQRAQADGFGHVFLGDPEIGGRFSVLSPFGLVPAVAMGLDPEKIVTRAQRELVALQGTSPSSAVQLGLALAACCAAGRNKVTLVPSPGLRSFGTWLEQLLAESTGKHGLGLVPVDGEPLRESTALGSDRVLVQLSIAGEQPVIPIETWPDVPQIEIELGDAYDLGAEFYTWQIATAIVGAELGINPFDQPDVESAKVATRKLVAELDPMQPLVAADAPSLAVSGDPSLEEALGSLLASDGADAGTYFTVLAYLPMSPTTREALSEIRGTVLTARGWATCLGFGPRYLHSTGQAHKGGPPQGRFLVLTAANHEERLIPGMNQRLAEVHRAQALGDFQVLQERGRLAVHIDLRGSLSSALLDLQAAVQAAL